MGPLTTTDALAAAIRNRNDIDRLVGIDGFMGSGKTKQAFDLAALLGGIRVGVDCYVDKDLEATSYVGKLRLFDLSKDLPRLCEAFPFVVLDGICLLEVLDLLSRPIPSMVYVKRISTQGLWHDGFELEDYESGQMHDNDWLPNCTLSYHSKWRPHERSTFVYERYES